MLLIYVSKLTNRVGYTLNLIFKSILHIPFEITLDENYYATFEGCKLCYSDKKISDGLYIKSVKLLYQTSIENQEIQMSEYDNFPIFFATYGKDQTLPFDIFAASFYLVSRYEEYLPHHKDYHQRFDFKDSLAYQKGFLHVPLVNKWANLLANKLKEAYPDFVIPLRKFHFVNTIDVDSAYSFKQKGVFRNVGGFIRDIFKQDYESVKMRAMVMLNRRKDPFDTFDFIISLSEKYHTELLFFILFADYDNYDKNISHNSLKFQQLIKHLADYSKVGIHPSYASMDQSGKLTVEIKRLSKVLHKPIVRSRFHFLRFQLPISYNNLIKNNIDSDFSMGYSNEYGFRASICTPFNFYDLETDAETDLIIHPFAVMDTALKTYLNCTTDEALNILKNIIDEIKSVDGTFYSIWHNNNLCESFGWEGWSKVYEQMIDYVYKQN
ncbi:MAG: polysaccharide deacetylase family protein [Bacteroidales bacterium]|nr:polysaccharide deacetylase family protein [Bacteroidales bacterium]